MPETRFKSVKFSYSVNIYLQFSKRVSVEIMSLFDFRPNFGRLSRLYNISAASIVTGGYEQNSDGF